MFLLLTLRKKPWTKRQKGWILVSNLALIGYKIMGLLMVSNFLSGSLLCLNTVFDQKKKERKKERKQDFLLGEGAELIELCN